MLLSNFGELSTNKDLILCPLKDVHSNLLDCQNKDQVEGNSGKVVDNEAEVQRGEVRVDKLENVHLLDKTILMVLFKLVVFGFYHSEGDLFVYGSKNNDNDCISK